jgi:hypothetical protein
MTGIAVWQSMSSIFVKLVFAQADILGFFAWQVLPSFVKLSYFARKVLTSLSGVFVLSPLLYHTFLPLHFHF